MSDAFDSLLEALADGDPEAREALITRLYPQVSAIVHRELERDFRKSHRWILPMFSTGDVVHDVFAQVVRNTPRFEGNTEAQVAAYLGAMVKNRLVDAVRYHEAGRRDRRRVVGDALPGAGVVEPEDVGGTPPAETAAAAEQVEIFRVAIAEFDDRQRELLELRLVDDCQFAEIADRVGYSSADVARKMFHDTHARLLVKLRARGVKPPGEDS